MIPVSARYPRCQRRRQGGLSLVELMISIVLGLLIVSAVIGVYLESKRNYAAEEEAARMQENGRFALNLLQRELMMAGFFGGTLEAQDVTPVAVTTDCAATDWALDPRIPLEFVNNHSGNANPQTSSGTTLTCLGGDTVEADTDVLTIKRTAGEPSLRRALPAPGLGTSVDAQWYLRFVNYGDEIAWAKISPAAIAALPSPALGLAYWEAFTRIFYVRAFSEAAGDGIPTLCEWSLIEDAMESRCLVEGIEDMQVEFGIDTNVDGVADRYLAAPTALEIETAVVARVYLLVRSLQELTDYQNTKTYQLGSKAVAAKNDGFMRRVFTTTVQIRNAVLPVS
jgi:hypothetical protein